MSKSKQTRRGFIGQAAGALAAGSVTPYVFTADAQGAGEPTSKNDRFGIGVIGLNNRGTAITRPAVKWGDVVAVCDVDRQVAERAKAGFGGKATIFEDYRKMLDEKNVDVVLIGTPDHWHAAQAIDCCRAGKDVFCEKPLTLTIGEGWPIIKAVEENETVFQVGTWRRNETHFRLACEMVRQGRLGKLHRVTAILGKSPTSGPFENLPVPSHLNWDLWLGQAPSVPYCPQRCHRTFRWWLEYSGGQMTDWGAHHIDVAQWGMDRDASGPIEIDGKATFPDIPNGYNVPIRYEARMKYDDGVELVVLDEAPEELTARKSGIMFEGEKGRIFVNSGGVYGKPAEDLADNPLPPEQYKLYAHDNPARPPGSGSGQATACHMGNFFDCVKTRNTPLSDVRSQHRTVSVCHLGTISMRLGRRLKWDPEKERFVGDDEANTYLTREQRAPYQVPG